MQALPAFRVPGGRCAVRADTMFWCPGVDVLTFHLDFKDEKFANQVHELDPNWICVDF